MNEKTNLTETEYWDKVWKNHCFPITVDVRSYPLKLMHEAFEKFLPKQKGLKLLELGCATGKWLLYFTKTFGYKIYGIEYSPQGYRITLDNISFSGVEAGIVQGDMFTTMLPEKMDIVFSYGVIEHFSDTKKAVQRHLDFLSAGGIVVVVVPNMASKFYRALQSSADKNVLECHYPVTLELLKSCMSGLSVREVYSGYIGVFGPGVINWSAAPMPVLRGINLLNKIWVKLAGLLNLKKETSTFSPYILYIGKK